MASHLDGGACLDKRQFVPGPQVRIRSPGPEAGPADRELRRPIPHGSSTIFHPSGRDTSLPVGAILGCDAQDFFHVFELQGNAGILADCLDQPALHSDRLAQKPHAANRRVHHEPRRAVDSRLEIVWSPGAPFLARLLCEKACPELVERWGFWRKVQFVQALPHSI